MEQFKCIGFIFLCKKIATDLKTSHLFVSFVRKKPRMDWVLSSGSHIQVLASLDSYLKLYIRIHFQDHSGCWPNPAPWTVGQGLISLPAIGGTLLSAPRGTHISCNLVFSTLNANKGEFLTSNSSHVLNVSHQEELCSF